MTGRLPTLLSSFAHFEATNRFLAVLFFSCRLTFKEVFSPGSPVFFFDLCVLLCHFFSCGNILFFVVFFGRSFIDLVVFFDSPSVLFDFWLTVFLQVQWPWWKKRGTGFRLSLKDGASDWLCCHQAENYPLASQK